MRCRGGRRLPRPKKKALKDKVAAEEMALKESAEKEAKDELEGREGMCPRRRSWRRKARMW
jgi:hypothetical protein